MEHENGRRGGTSVFHVPHDVPAAEAQERRQQCKCAEAQRNPETHQAPTVLFPETAEDAYG